MIYLNNGLVPGEKALISVYDHGFLYGDGIYETLRAYRGVVFKIDDHIYRLFRSADMIGLKISKSRDAVRKAVYETIEANNHAEAVVRITVSRGAGPIGLDPDLCPLPTFVIMSKQFRPYPRNYYQKGVKIAIVDIRRNYDRAISPKIKSLNFLNNVLAKIEAKRRGAYEALMLNYKGFIAEGTVSNVFFVRDNILCTPAEDVGILDGITRRIILEVAKESAIETHEGRFRRKDLYNAQEVFISSTAMEVMPVAAVNEKVIRGTPGKISRILRRAYKKQVAVYTKKHQEAQKNNDKKD